jgi:hypothetical protein
MDPVSSKFFHDSEQYIYQTPNVRIINNGQPPQKPFDIKSPDKSKKSKKDAEKGKSEERKSDDHNKA